MQNLSELQANSTAHNKLTVIVKVCVVIPLLCMFLCCIGVMLHIFVSHRQLLDTSRYILFFCMLINDTMQVVSSVVLFGLAVCQIEFPLVYCVPLLFISTATFQYTLLILAAMSLERYVAIVYPLQRPAAWRSDRIWVIILVLWFFSCLLPLVDFSIGKLGLKVNAFSTLMLCKPNLVNASPAQVRFRAVGTILYFAVVGVVIFFTYVRILLEARKLRQDRASVSKAMHTVLLHGFQLVLCLLAFTHHITETMVVARGWQPQDLAFFNYFSFVLIPRFLSPLIYGFRDQSLRAYIGKTLLYCSKKISPHVKGIVQDKLSAS